MKSLEHRYACTLAMTLCASIVLVSAGCGILRPTRGRYFESTETSGFLRDYSQLKPRKGYEAQEVYVNPNARWPLYHAIHIESVSMWIADETKKHSPQETQMLTDMLYKSLHKKLSEKFEIADHADPGVLQVRAALTEAKGAHVVLNTVTTVIPQARAADTLLGLGTDTAALVGTASVEADVTDSITKLRLAAIVDSRAGTKGVTRMLSKWADVEAACDYWAERATEFFVAQGVQQKH